MVYQFFDKKTDAGVDLNEQLAEILHKPAIKKFKRRKSMLDLQTTFGQLIWQKWNHCLLRIKMLNIYYVSQMFSLNMLGWVKPLKDKQDKTVLNAFIKIVN